MSCTNLIDTCISGPYYLSKTKIAFLLLHFAHFQLKFPKYSHITQIT